MFLLLMLHVLFHQARLRLALRGIRVGTGKDREGDRLAEKDKQDTSCNFLHKLSIKQAYSCGLLLPTKGICLARGATRDKKRVVTRISIPV
jgi:hypothetical protein